MKTRIICIFGASGKTGSVLVQQAVKLGLEVVAFNRSETSVNDFPAGVRFVTGSMLERSDVDSALSGVEAVICAFGPRATNPQVFCAQATQTIIAAMKAHGIHRLLCITGAMIGEYPRRRSFFMRWMKQAFEKQQPEVARDREEQERLVATSDLAWTILKPPRLTDGEARSRYRTGPELGIGAFSQISRADLSSFILSQIDSEQYVQQRVVIQY